MKQKLILHSGLMKTGSTALEHFCEINADVLKKHNIAFSPYRLYEHWPKHEEPYSKAIDFIGSQVGKGKDILVCDECIYPILAQDTQNIDLQKRFPSLDIQVVIYLRRQDVHIESLFNFLQFADFLLEPFEWIDYPSKFTTIFPGVTPESYDYYSWLKPLSENIGKENIKVRVFESAKFVGGSLFSDFLDALEVPFSDDFEVQHEKANLSLDHRFTELLNVQYAMFPDPPGFEKTTLINGIKAVNQTMGITKNRVIFSAEERSGMLDYFNVGNNKIAKEFLGSDEPLFSDKMPTGEKDTFKEGELEMVPGLLNKLWFETVLNMDFGTFNTFKLRVYQHRYHNGDKSAYRKYKFHKLINSIGKRFKKNFYSPVKFVWLEDFNTDKK